MVRLACINFPRIDLQILALRHNEWKQIPAAVVTEEKPLGRITEANRAARTAGVQPGMRFASALSVCPELRAGVIQPEDRAELREWVVSRLRSFTPEVEPSAGEPALFWVDAGGLDRLYPSLGKWAGAIQLALEETGLVSSIAVGFTRFGTYAAAKRKRTITLFTNEDQEEATAMRSPIGVLSLPHDVLLRLQQLGLYTVRDFVRFSPGALRRRFGRDVESLQRFARGESTLPVQGESESDPFRREIRLLYPEIGAESILGHLLSMLHQLTGDAFAHRLLVTAITLSLYPEAWPGRVEPEIVEQIRTARATLDNARLDRLVKLRLESVELPGPVVRLAVEVDTVPNERQQNDLFAGSSSRDPRKALAAIAEICAELGNDAVQIARLQDEHRPEQTFTWCRIGGGESGDGSGELTLPRPRPATGNTLVRRVLASPMTIGVPDFARSPTEGSVCGPYEVSGGWWDQPYERHYYLVEQNHALQWIYFDANSREWYAQGTVE